jgi:O-antigen ligase
MKINLAFPVLGLYVWGLWASQSLLSLMGSLCILLALLWKDHWRVALKNPFSWALAWILLSALNLISKNSSLESLLSLKDLPYLLIPLAAPFIARKLGNQRITEQYFFKTFFYGSLLLLSAAMGRSFYQAFIQLRPATGLMRNQIYFAYSILPLFLICAEFSLQKSFQKKWRVTFASIAICLALLLVLSHTRMTWIVLLLWSLFRALPYLWQHGKKSWGLGLLGGLSLLLVFLFFYQPDFQNKVGRMFDHQDPSRIARTFIWNFNLEQFQAAPLFGMGYEQNGVIPLDGELRTSFVNAGLNPDFKVYAHNVFIQSLVDNGIIGFIIWAIYWAMLGYKTKILGVFLVFMSIAGMTENIFNNSRAAHALYFSVLLLLVWEHFHKVRAHEH